MTDEQELVQFNVYDNNGDLYSTYISRKECRETDGHAARTMRLLKRLKDCGQKPVNKWDESIDFNNASAAADTSEWMPRQQARSLKPTKPASQARKGLTQKQPSRRQKLEFVKPPPPLVPAGMLPPRATGKSGADWGSGKTDKFLDTCLPYTDQLQCRSVPLEFWQHISDVLYSMDPFNLNYSAEQLREKMRLLKHYSNQKKEGKHGSTVWEHQKKMGLLFGKALEASTYCEPSMSHGIQDMFAVDYKGYGKCSGSLEEQFSHLSATSSTTSDMLSISGLENFDNDLGIAPLTEEDLSGTGAVCTVLPVFNSRAVSLGKSTSLDINGNFSNLMLRSEDAVPKDMSDEPSFMRQEATASKDLCADNDSTLVVIPAAVPSSLDNSNPNTEDFNWSVIKPMPTLDTNVRNIPYEVAQARVVSKQDDLGMNSTYSHFNHSSMKASTPTRSPAKKKLASGPVYSPRKANKSATPKRKIGAVHLVWDQEVTDKFMDLCVTKKESLKNETIPYDVWKEIHDDLDNIGIKKEWQVLRAKFENMDKFFRKLLETKGMANGVLWPYYARFCSIYDIDEGFELLDDVPEEHLSTPRKTKKLWQPEREKLLLSLYSEKKPKFDGSKCPMRHSILYHQIAVVMNLFDVPVNARQCKAHMSTLLDEFRKAYDQGNKSGGAAPSFPLYAEMLKIFEGCPTLEAPIAVTIGRGVVVTRNGVKETEAKRNSQSKLKLVEAATSKGKPINQYSTLPSAQPSETKVADEVRRIADIYEHESDRKYELFSRMVNTMEELKRLAK